MDSSPDDQPKFRLVAEFTAHDGAVRAICVGMQGQIISGGQDAAAKVWQEDTKMGEAGEEKAGESTGTMYSEAGIALEHSHWVTALCPLEPGILEECPQGGFITGCLDHEIRVYTHEAVYVKSLKGHTGGVISFSWTTDDKKLISGSWDGTAKTGVLGCLAEGIIITGTIWDLAGGTCEETFAGHENGVCVLGLASGAVATGSTGLKNEADQVVHSRVRLWARGGAEAPLAVLEDHEGPVRHLAPVPGLGFASTSNDGAVAIRTEEGERVATLRHPLNLEGHPTFVLGGAALAGGAGAGAGAGGEGLFVAVGDDGPTGGCTVWGLDGQLVQGLPHAKGVWAVAALPNGDFATACQDHKIRVFSRHPARWGPEALMVGFCLEYEEALKRGRRGPGSDEVAKLPRWEDRHSRQGKAQGAVSLFNKDGKAIAAEWTAVSGSWIEIGEVTGSANAGTIDGVTYDHVFPIEIEQLTGGVVTLEIGYNNGQNPFLAAQAFIDKHMLPQDHLAKIADYIIQRAGQAAPMLGDQPAAAAGAAAGGGGGGGWSGVGVPGGAQFSSLGDPVATAGGGRGGGGGPACRHFPGRPLVYDAAAALAKGAEKLREFNGGLPEGTALDTADFERVLNIVQTLSATSRYHVSTIDEKEIKALNKLLKQWPNDKVFPGIDILRVMLVHPDGSQKLSAAPETAQEILPMLIQKALELKDSVAVPLLVLRALCNALRHPALGAALCAGPAADGALELAAELAAGAANKNVRASAATLAMNLGLALAQDAGVTASEARTAQLLGLVSGALAEIRQEEDENAFRLLVAVGTLLQNPSLSAQVASQFNDLEMRTSLNSLVAQPGKSQKVKESIEDIMKLIQSG